MSEKKEIKVKLSIHNSFTEPLRDFQKKIDDSFPKIKRTFAGLSNLMKGISKNSGLNQVMKSSKEFGSAMGDVGKEVGALGAKLGGIAAVGVGGMLALVKSTADYGSELIDVAKRIDFGVEAFQEWRYAAEQSGVSNEDFTKGVEKFTRSMGEAKAGQGALFSFLKQTNPELLKQVLHAKSNDEAFGLMVNSLGQVKDAQKQAMYANLLFGKTGKNFTNMANEGADGIKKLRGNARDLGLVMSELDAKNAEDFGDQWSTVEQVFGGIKNMIGVQLMPAISELMQKFLAWTKENREEIKGFAKMLGEKLPGAIQSIRDQFDSFANGKIVGFIRFLGDTFGYLNVGMIAVAAVLGGPLLMSLIALIPTVYSLGVALMTTPIGWIIGAIAALVATIYGLWKLCVWVAPYIQKAFSIAFDWIGEKINWLLEKFSIFKKYLSSVFGGKDQKQEIDINKTQKIVGDGVNAQPQSSTTQAIQNYVSSKNQKSESEIKVSFDNLPRGARVSSKGDSSIFTDYRMGILGDSAI